LENTAELEYSVVGKRLPRKDAIEKVTGKFQCTADIQLPGMLYAKILHSPYSHARIVKIDTSKAEEVPGVKCVLTHLNTKKMHVNWHFGPPLDEVLHYQGEEAAVVAAITPKIAEEALKLIDIEYEVLPAVYDSEEALKPDAPLIHPDYRSDNTFRGYPWQPIGRMDEDGFLRLEYGDINKGLSEADIIVEGDNTNPMQFPISPAPRAVVADWQGDQLTAWIDSQTPNSQMPGIAGYLGIPQSKIRIISHCIGGYGNKQPVKCLYFAALIAKKTGRPVKMQYTREEDFIGTHRRVEFKVHNKVGVKKDGTITGMYSKCIANQGADTGFAFISMGTALVEPFTLLYDFKNSKAEIMGVTTNITSYGAVNGFGAPEGMYGVEKVMDKAAEAIDMDPIEFRLRNCIHYGSPAIEMQQAFNGPKDPVWGVLGPDLDAFRHLIEKCREDANWKEKWKGWHTPAAVNGAKRKGIGFAIGMHHAPYWASSSFVIMNPDGSATVMNNAVEIGQGFKTAVAQVVAESLGISYDKVTPVLSDSAVCGQAFGNVASQGTTSHVYSAKMAADNAREQMLAWAADKMGTTPDQLAAKNNFVYMKENPEKKMSIAEICGANYQIFGTFKNPPISALVDPKSGKIVSSYASTAAIVEVEVDTETGQVKVERMTGVNDVGVAINPDNCENQIDLGMIMAKGWVLNENPVIDRRTGAIMNPNLVDYKINTILDIPDRKDFVGEYVERPYPFGPYGAKGFSETACTAVAPAISNAVYNAIGVRVEDGFISPAAILRALEKKKQGR